MTSEADRLAAEGTRIQGADGGEVAVRFTLAALKRCEDRYGTLDGTVKEIHWLVQQDSTGYPDAVTGRLIDLLTSVTGAQQDYQSTPDVCISAVVDAWLEAFPAPEGKAEGETETPPPSLGAPGGGSPSQTPG